MRALLAALLLAFLAHGSARADTLPDYRQVAKWAISYNDGKLGRVEGIALCNWGDGTAAGSGPSCHLKLRNPATGALSSVTVPAQLLDGGAAGGALPRLSITLDMKSLPTSERVTAPPVPGQQIAASDGESATVILGNGNVERRWQTKVARGGPGDNQVRFDLVPNSVGTLDGFWSYLANPMTERGADGIGPAGAFRMLSDDEIKERSAGAGGFLGLAVGGATWRPMLPRVYGVYTIEDESEFRYGEFRFPRGPSPGIPAERFDDSTGARPESVFRTLVLIGSDLPLDEGKALLPIKSKRDGLTYEILAVGDGSAKVTTDRWKAMIERAFRELTHDMDAKEAAAYRKLDAVVVHVMLEPKPDPGPQRFTWGTLTGRWELQYGDSIADIRFARVFNEKESEATSQLALPESVVIEVETGAEIADETIPIRFGQGSADGPGREMTASRIAGHPRLYRTPPLVFAAEGAVTP
ncbi:MAG TPA: hypothetical protein VEC75_11200, partial [Stellaceae bacterium]|nr:hypothetical protein [Stellaceae bacterium]